MASPYSPDFNSFDYFFGVILRVSAIKRFIALNRDKPTTADELKQAIRKAVRNIDIDMLHRMFSCIIKKIEYCAQNKGVHFENKLQ